MKIIHVPLEIAGQMGILCGELKRNGHQAIGYNYYHTALGFTNHILPADGNEIVNVWGEAIQHFDLFHFHYMLTPILDFRDLAMIEAAGKPSVMHHWGSDVRKPSMAKMNNPYVNMDNCPTDEEIHERLEKVSKYISTALVQDYEVLPYVEPYYKQVHIIPVAIETAKFTPAYPRLDEYSPLVVHAPTQPQYKGTAAVERAIGMLQKEIPFRYQRIEKMSHKQAKEVYRQADIIIDQILVGSFGILAVESMAFGKPVIAYVREDLVGKYDGLPICSANPDTLYDVLKPLLLSAELRNLKGREGRAYVEKYHDSRIVGAQVINIYEQLLRERAAK